ncbi:cell division protein FtsK [Nonomuraea sp. NPDC059023]|uniref:cell division protein FtsK n=1 Tax=unclassified Nonomuraea TaxID=2593643 RepID=UPI0036BCB6A6
MRRDARRMRRYGVQPVASITDDLEFAPLVVTSIGRWLWRYRSELAPVAVAVWLMGIGLMLHHLYRPWWPTIAGSTAVLAAALIYAGRWVNLTRPIERAYAAMATAFAGGWLAIATHLGPFAEPLPLVLAGGGILLAVPWWAHRRRRARVRVERTLAAWPHIADAVSLAGSRVQSAIVDVWGYRFRLALGMGQTVEDAVNRIPALESALSAKRGAIRVQPVPTGEANRADVRVIETDPHADAITWPGPSITSITQPVKLGLFEDGTPVRVSLLRRHALLGGIAGAGKSGTVNVVMGELTACPDVILWGIDLKGGMELMPWSSCLDRIATTPQEAEALLADGVTILDARADHLARAGERVWNPSPAMPALVILIDEYAELSDDAPNALRHADSIARRGRAIAVQLVAATQRPSQKAMGKGAVRSQMDVRIACRVREQRDVDLILGQGMLKAGWHAHRLDAPGKFLITAPEHDTPRRARTYLLTDTHVQATADRHSAGRPRLDAVSAAALESTPETEPRRETRADDAEQALKDALADAPPEGIAIGDLISATGMGRRWVYYRLDELARAKSAEQIARGRWRATPHSP